MDLVGAAPSEFLVGAAPSKFLKTVDDDEPKLARQSGGVRSCDPNDTIKKANERAGRGARPRYRFSVLVSAAPAFNAT